MSFHLFQAFGVELEYMIVDRETFRVAPITDRLLEAAAALPGASVDEEEDPEHPGSVELGDAAWSNELAPTMVPDRDMKLWPHGYSEVYGAFNRIFDCRGHGWSNLQSAHLNLPFQIDESADTPEGEFGRLHAAIRFLLPIMPALSASSPIMDGRPTGLMDNRLEVYRHNARAVPIVSGRVVPEAVFTKKDYDATIFQAIYAALAPHDPQGVLRHEWANSRGAIARFSRNTIEVRVLDVQECPSCDLAVLAAITSAIRAVCEGRLGDLAELRTWGVEPLHRILMSVIRDGDLAKIQDAAYLKALGYPGAACTAGELWRHLTARTLAGDAALHAEVNPALGVILEHGCLARRIIAATGANPDDATIERVYRRLGECLANNTPFLV